MKVKVMNFKNYIERECSGKTEFERPRAVFQGTKGIVLSDYEFIHCANDLITDSFRVYICNQHKENEIPLFPTGYVVEQVSILLKECDVEEIEVSDFFRNPNYNSRLSSNFRVLLESLNNIGFDSAELVNDLKIKNKDKR